MSSKSMEEFSYILWQDYGSEGWVWTGYDSIREALKHENYGKKTVITKIVEFELKEIL